MCDKLYEKIDIQESFGRMTIIFICTLKYRTGAQALRRSDASSFSCSEYISGILWAGSAFAFRSCKRHVVFGVAEDNSLLSIMHQELMINEENQDKACIFQMPHT